MGRIRYTVTRIIKRKMLHIVTTKYFVLAVEKPFSCDLRVFSEISKLPTMFFFLIITTRMNHITNPRITVSSICLYYDFK